MKYITIINNLKHSINNKGENELFKNSLMQLKTEFNQEVSTKFLRMLCGDMDFRKRTKRINYLLKTTGFKTKNASRFYTEKTYEVFNKEIKDFSLIDFKKVTKKSLINKDEIRQHEKFKPFSLTYSEQEQIKQLKKVSDLNRVDLMPRAEQDLKERQHRKNQIYNTNGGFFKLKSIRNQEVGREFINPLSEVLFMVQV